MQLIKKRGILIFWLLLVIDCVYILTNDQKFRWATKPLLIPILLLYIFQNARKNYHRTYKIYIFFALICAWAGDILLLKEDSHTFFLVGMLCFLVMHVFYTLTFLRVKPIKIAKSQEALIASIALIYIAFKVFDFISDDLGTLKFAVLGYMVVVVLMGIAAANTLTSSARRSLALNHFVPGAGLFILSDIILAVDRFHFHEPFLQVAVMISYGYAQSLLVEGFTKMLKA